MSQDAEVQPRCYFGALLRDDHYWPRRLRLDLIGLHVTISVSLLISLHGEALLRWRLLRLISLASLVCYFYDWLL